MSAAADQDAIIAALRAWPADAQVRSAALRREAGLSAADYAAAVRALRFAGKMDWDRLALAPSMLKEIPERGVGHGSRDLPRDGIDHPHAPTGLPHTAPAREGGRAMSAPPTALAQTPHAADLAQAEAIYAGKPSVTAQVKAEALASGARLRAASKASGSHLAIELPSPDRLGFGAQLQDLALRDDPAAAIHALRIRWNPLWQRVCDRAAHAGKRPFIALIDLIEAGLEGDAHGAA